MNIIDRYLLRQFLQNFAICFVSLMGVYVIFDIFTNLEAFMGIAKGVALMKVLAAYYGIRFAGLLRSIERPAGADVGHVHDGVDPAAS